MSPRRSAKRDRWVVVLAEDDDDHAVLIERAVEGASRIPVEVHRARNGEEAVDLAEEIVPDLLLLDLKMPGRSGHEVLERLKGDDRLRKIPIAVLTSSDRDEDVARSYGLGGNHFIKKPEDPRDLERRLEALLENLSELQGIRRGAGGLEPTATSALDAGTFTLRKWIGWGAALAILLGLLVFAYLSGAFG